MGKKIKVFFIIFLSFVFSFSLNALAAGAVQEGKQPDTIYLLIGKAASETYEKNYYIQKIVEDNGYKFTKIESKDYFITNSLRTKAIIAIQPDKAMLADIYASVNSGKNAVIVLDNDAYADSKDTLDELYNLFGIKISKTPLVIGKDSVIYGTNYCQIYGALTKLSGNFNTQIIIDTLHKGSVSFAGGIKFYQFNNDINKGNPYTFYSNKEDPELTTSAFVSIGKGKCLVLVGGGLFNIFSDKNVQDRGLKLTRKEQEPNGANYIAIDNIVKWLVTGRDQSVMFDNIALFGFVGMFFAGPVGICLGEQEEKKRFNKK